MLGIIHIARAFNPPFWRVMAYMNRFQPGPYSPTILQTILCLIIKICLTRIHQQFSRTSYVFFIKICKLECKITSDWLNLMLHSNVSTYMYRKIWKTKLRTPLFEYGDCSFRRIFASHLYRSM